MNDLTLTCEMCGLPITKGTGSLFVRTAVVTQALQAHHAHEAAAEPAAGLDLAELLAMPDDIRWESSHDACRVYPEDDRYEIAADQIDTWPKLARWTAHLMEKGWFALSDWDQVLREAAGEAPVPGDRQRIRAIAREAA